MADPKGLLVVPVGFDPGGDPRALELTADDYLKVALAAYVAGTLTEIAGKDATATVRELLVSTTGRMLIDPGGADKLFAYESAVGETVSNLDLAAGTNALSSTVVPAGKAWVITHAAVAYSGTVLNVLLQLHVAPTMGDYQLLSQTPVISNVFYDRQGWFVLEAGRGLYALVYNATLHDDLYLTYGGFQMDAS